MPQVSTVRENRRMSPTRTSPTSPRKTVPQGFIAYKPKQKPIHNMTIRELQDMHARNVSILSEPYVSMPLSATTVDSQRIDMPSTCQQRAIHFIVCATDICRAGSN